MWPWGHLAVAYCCYSWFAGRRYDRPPSAASTLAVAIGSQLPDLIDKPLAWTFDVLPGGRTLAHSLLFAAGVVALAIAVSRAIGRLEVGLAFAIGHVSHLLADLPEPIVAGDFYGTWYLVWPLLEPPTYGAAPDGITDGLLEAFLGYATSPSGVLEIGLFVLAVVIWYRDRMPGLEYARLALERVIPAGP